MSGYLSDGIIILCVLGVLLAGLPLMYRHGYRRWYLEIFNSRVGSFDLNLYFGLVSMLTLFLYTAYAVLIRHFEYSSLDFGRGIGAIFIGVGLNAVGTGLQKKVEGDPEEEDGPDEDEPPLSAAVLILKLLDPADAQFELHLLLGALAITMVIIYTGYDLAYYAHGFDPSEYGDSLAYMFVAVGAAGWGQGIQRRLQRKTKHNKKHRHDNENDE